MALVDYNSYCSVCQRSQNETELSATGANLLFSKIPKSSAAHLRFSCGALVFRGAQFGNHWLTPSIFPFFSDTIPWDFGRRQNGEDA